MQYFFTKSYFFLILAPIEVDILWSVAEEIETNSPEIGILQREIAPKIQTKLIIEK